MEETLFADTHTPAQLMLTVLTLSASVALALHALKIPIGSS